MNKKEIATSFGFGILLALFFWTGFLVRTHIPVQAMATTGNIPEDIVSSDFNIFWETWQTLSKKYPFDEEEPTNQERIYAATAGMVRSFGDPHTVFLPPKDAELFTQDVNGAFGGVGMEVDMKEGLATVVAPLKGSPAEKAGIMAEDIIFAVNDVSVHDMDIDSVIGLIRGKKGTPVTLTILREGESERLDITVIRDTIAIPTISTEALTPDIFYIALYSFTENSPELVRGALSEFTASKSKSLVFDLRSNPGGYLQAGVEIASMFLPEGTVIVKEHNGKNTHDVILRSIGYDLVDKQVPMIVLVDGGSASASEIFAGALGEHNRAKLLGTTTFGKGSVQELVELSDKSALKVTVAQWLTPNGISLSDGGLEPDYEIINRIDEDGTFVDVQLQEAQKILEKELSS